MHGNWEALRTLPEKYDELWVLGDLVNYGPEPGAIVDFAKEKATIVVRGNHDHSIAYDEDPRCTSRYQKMADTTRRYTASVLAIRSSIWPKALQNQAWMVRKPSLTGLWEGCRHPPTFW